MSTIAFTLLTDGTSDRVLIPFISGLMDLHCPHPFIAQFADELPSNAKTVGSRIRAALMLFPCDILFVHRDSEGQTVTMREAEIRQGLEGLPVHPPLVCAVPIRMTEAWLLTSESAIRAAVGNPHGTAPLNLPPRSQVENIADAKAVLDAALEAAKDLGARRRRRFRAEPYRHRVVDFIDDFDHLRQLRSFAHLESQISALFSRAP